MRTITFKTRGRGLATQDRVDGRWTAKIEGTRVFFVEKTPAHVRRGSKSVTPQVYGFMTRVVKEPSYSRVQYSRTRLTKEPHKTGHIWLYNAVYMWYDLSVELTNEEAYNVAKSMVENLEIVK